MNSAHGALIVSFLLLLISPKTSGPAFTAALSLVGIVVSVGLIRLRER